MHISSHVKHAVCLPCGSDGIWRGVDHRVAAVIRTAADGGPVRLRRNGRQKRSVGVFYSVKNGRHLVFESSNELHDLWRAEADWEVVGSSPQDHVLEFWRGGKAVRYVPDRRDTLAGGQTRIVEVKGDGAELKDEAYFDKLACAASIYEALGWSFVIHRRAEIEAEPSFGSAETIRRYGRTRVDMAHTSAVIDALERSGPRTVAWAQDRLGGGGPGLARVCALIVRRFIRVDLSRGLIGDALVRSWEQA